MFLLAGVLTLTPCVTSFNPEWKVHGGAKYAYFADRVTWEEAKAACNAIVDVAFRKTLKGSASSAP